MKRKILNLVMLAVVIVLAIGVYFATQNKKKPPKPPLTSLNAATINSITIEKPGKKTLVLKRGKGQWRFAKPFKVDASNANVSSILSVATSKCENAIKPSEVKLANLGLKPPKYTVTFNKTKVAIGGQEPLKYRRYAMTGGRICLIADPSAPGLGSQNYANLVSTKLVPENRTLVKIAIPGYTLSRNTKAGHWALSPADSQAEKGAADKLAKAWQSGHSMWNSLAKNSKKSKTAKNTKAVTLFFKDGSEIHYRIAAQKPKLKLLRTAIGIQYDVSGADAKKLLTLAAKKPKPSKTEKTHSLQKPLNQQQLHRATSHNDHAHGEGLNGSRQPG